MKNLKVASENDMYFYILSKVYEGNASGIWTVDLWNQVFKKFRGKNLNHNDLAFVFQNFITAVTYSLTNDSKHGNFEASIRSIPNRKIVLKPEWVRHYIEMVELKEARNSSNWAIWLSLLAIVLSVIIGVAQIISGC